MNFGGSKNFIYFLCLCLSLAAGFSADCFADPSGPEPTVKRASKSAPNNPVDCVRELEREGRTQTGLWPLPPDDYQHVPFLNFTTELGNQARDYENRGIDIHEHPRLPGYLVNQRIPIVEPSDSEVSLIQGSIQKYFQKFGKDGFESFAWAGIDSANPLSKDEEYRWDLLKSTGLYRPKIRARIIQRLQELGIRNLRLGIPNHLIDIHDPKSWKPLDEIVDDFAKAGIRISMDLHHFGIEDRYRVLGPDGKTNHEQSYYLNPKWPEEFAEFALAAFIRYHDRVPAYTFINELEPTAAFNSEFWHGGYPGWKSKNNMHFYIARALRIAEASVRARFKIEEYLRAHPEIESPLFIQNEATNYKRNDPEFNAITRFFPCDLVLGHPWLMQLNLKVLNQFSVQELSKKTESENTPFAWMFRNYVLSQPESERPRAKRELFFDLIELQNLHRSLPVPMRKDMIFGVDYYTFNESGYGIPEEGYGEHISPEPQHYSKQVSQDRRSGLHRIMVEYFNHLPMAFMIAETGTPYYYWGEKYYAQQYLEAGEAAKDGIPVMGITAYPAIDTGFWRTVGANNPDKDHNDSIIPSGIISRYGHIRPYAKNFFGKARRRMDRLAPELRGVTLGPDLKMLTGAHLQPAQDILPTDIQEIPDPAPPYINDDGSVEIYGSAQYFIRYKSEQDFESAGHYEIVPLDMRYSDGSPIKGTYVHDWDLRKYKVITPGQEPYEILLGGGMTPQPGHKLAVWPDDNPGRRVFIYKKNAEGAWVRSKEPIVGKLDGSWEGHHYGGNFFQIGNKDPNVIYTDKPIYYFTENVTPLDNRPYDTGSVVYELDSNFKPISGPHEVVGKGSPPNPLSVRQGGGYLGSEGPRAIEAFLSMDKSKIVVGDSSSDFCTDCYTMKFAVADHPLGPYRVFTLPTGQWRDFGERFKKKYNLSWLGRPALYPKGGNKFGLMFHGVRKDILPQNDYTKWPGANSPYQLWEFFRSIFLTNVEITSGQNGEIEIVLPDPETGKFSARSAATP